MLFARLRPTKIAAYFFSALLTTVIAGAAVLAQPSQFEVAIYRQYASSVCTSGYLAVNGEIISYTLEKSWNNNAAFISSIPAGRYPGFLRYDKKDRWRIQLIGVPGRAGIQLHIGFSPQHTAGCILLGKEMKSDLCHLGQSDEAYSDFKKAFYGSSNPVSSPNLKIVVVIADR